MKPFEEKLTNEINRAFDTFDAPVDEAAWGDLRGVLVQRRRRRMLIWWRSAAAALLLLLVSSGALWWVLSPEKAAPTALTAIGDDTAVEAAPPSFKNQEVGTMTSETDPASVTPATLEEAVAKSEVSAHPIPSAAPPASPSDHPHHSPARQLPSGQAHSPAELADMEAPQRRVVIPAVATLNLRSPRLLAINASVLPTIPSLPAETTMAAPHVPGVRPWGFSAQVGAYGSFTPQTLPSGWGLQGGGMLHYQLSDRWSLGTGLMLDYHRFEDASYGDRGETLQFKVEEFQTQATLHIEETRALRMEWTAIDVPLLVTWRYAGSEQRGYTLSAGMSSLIYLDQRIRRNLRRHTVTQIPDPVSFELVPYIVSTDTEDFRQVAAFERMDLLRYVQVSAGIPLPLRGYALSVETYVRAPLGPVSSADVFPAMAGVQLRLGL